MLAEPSANMPGDVTNADFKGQYAPPFVPGNGQMATMNPWAAWNAQFAARYPQGMPALHNNIPPNQYGMEPFAHQLRSGAGNRNDQQGFAGYNPQYGHAG